MKPTDEAEKQIQEVLDKHGMKISYDILFPMYNQLPDEVRLALSVLHRHGMKIVFVLKPKEEEKV